MAVRALAANGEQIVNTETYVSSALAFDVQAFLPNINDGTGGSVAVDAEIRVETTAGGSVELLTKSGRRAGLLPSRSQGVLVARAGTIQAEPDSWNFELRPQTPVAVATAAPAGGTGVAAGGYDTAGNRDIMIALVNAMRTCLIDNGLMKAE
jgi:hypothetical protein